MVDSSADYADYNWTTKHPRDAQGLAGVQASSILTYAMCLAVWIAILLLFFRYADRHTWSRGQTKLMAGAILLPTVTPFVLVWALIERKVHVYEKHRWRASAATMRCKGQ